MFKLFVPIILVLLLVNQTPKYLRSSQLSKYNGETIGIVDTLIHIKGIDETEIGGRISTKTFKIHYEYQVEEQVFKSIEFINKKELGIDEKTILKLFKKGDRVTIKYDVNSPGKSKILIK